MFGMLSIILGLYLMGLSFTYKNTQHKFLQIMPYIIGIEIIVLVTLNFYSHGIIYSIKTFVLA